MGCMEESGSGGNDFYFDLIFITFLSILLIHCMMYDMQGISYSTFEEPKFVCLEL